jgi:hypothetical protein
VFQNAQCVKVNPDTPQKQVRFLTLSGQLAMAMTASIMTAQIARVNTP